jgi:uncharacterized protein YkwD
MKLKGSKPLSLIRKIVYTLILLLLLAGGPLGILLAGFSIAWVWRQEAPTKKTKAPKRKNYSTLLILVSFVVLYAGYTVYWNIQNPSIKPQSPSKTASQKASEDVKQQFSPSDWLKAVNTVRTAHNAPKLKLDSRLNASSAEHAKDLQKYGWDSTPHYTQQRGLQGYDYIFKHWPSCVGGENLVETSNPTAGVQLWLGSSSHREAMLNPDLRYAGFATRGENTVFHMCS